MTFFDSAKKARSDKYYASVHERGAMFMPLFMEANGGLSNGG